MSESELEQLIQGAFALDLPLSEAQGEKLLAYQALISKWNRVYNLTSVRDPAHILTHHLLDSLSVVAPLQRYLHQHTTQQPVRLLDVGSGAGLPGAVIAIAIPELHITCVDTVGKKASFIRQVKAELHLQNLEVEHARVENLQIRPANFIISRAFASLSDFTSLTHRHLADGGTWVAMKGKVPTSELAALPPNLDVFHVEHLSVPQLDAERCLIWIKPRAIAG